VDFGPLSRRITNLEASHSIRGGAHEDVKVEMVSFSRNNRPCTAGGRAIAILGLGPKQPTCIGGGAPFEEYVRFTTASLPCSRAFWILKLVPACSPR
jgi:hypothetical protein